jgi:N-carbamoyl-L-amino-acid hydrolase
MAVDGERMRATWEAMAAIGATPAGGITRLALSDVDKLGRDAFVGWCREAGLDVRVDDIGNIAGWRAGDDPKALPVVCGSHLDSVARGGNYDGVLGVLAGLEVARTLDDRGVRTRRPFVVMSFTNEEGVRFQPPMMCSGMLAGAFTREAIDDVQDSAGQRFGDELDRIGYRGERRNRLDRLHAYFELHIEQGPVLEANDLAVGVVTMIQGLRRARVRFTGSNNHAGTTPMDARRDAFMATAAFALEARSMVRDFPPGMLTIGRVVLDPGLPTVIPEFAECSLDIRHPNDGALATMLARAETIANDVACREKCSVDFAPFWHSPPTPFAPELIECIAAAAQRQAVPTMRLYSGAGHDAKYMADLAPTAMIFVRTRAGRSHCEDEYARWEDCVVATSMLYDVVAETAGARAEVPA